MQSKEIHKLVEIFSELNSLLSRPGNTGKKEQATDYTNGTKESKDREGISINEQYSELKEEILDSVDRVIEDVLSSLGFAIKLIGEESVYESNTSANKEALIRYITSAIRGAVPLFYLKDKIDRLIEELQHRDLEHFEED